MRNRCAACAKNLTIGLRRQIGNTPARLYLIDWKRLAPWRRMCFCSKRMAIARRLGGTIFKLLFFAIVNAPGAAAENRAESHVLVPVQLSMGRKVPASTLGARKQTRVPAKPSAGAAQADDQRLAEALRRLSPKERKQLAKAMKRLTPEQRKQLTEALKRQLAGKGKAPQAIQRVHPGGSR